MIDFGFGIEYVGVGQTVISEDFTEIAMPIPLDGTITNLIVNWVPQSIDTNNPTIIFDWESDPSIPLGSLSCTVASDGVCENTQDCVRIASGTNVGLAVRQSIFTANNTGFIRWSAVFTPNGVCP